MKKLSIALLTLGIAFQSFAGSIVCVRGDLLNERGQRIAVYSKLEGDRVLSDQKACLADLIHAKSASMICVRGDLLNDKGRIIARYNKLLGDRVVADQKACLADLDTAQ